MLKQTDDAVERRGDARTAGIPSMSADGAIGFVQWDTGRHTLAEESEAFYLRIAQAFHALFDTVVSLH